MTIAAPGILAPASQTHGHMTAGRVEGAQQGGMTAGPAATPTVHTTVSCADAVHFHMQSNGKAI